MKAYNGDIEPVRTVPDSLRQYFRRHTPDERHQGLHVSPHDVHCLVIEALARPCELGTIAFAEKAENELLHLCNAKAWMQQSPL